MNWLFAERKLSFKAFQGAMLASMYSDEPSMHLPYQVITYLKDIEALMLRWRSKLCFFFTPLYTDRQKKRYKM